MTTEEKLRKALKIMEDVVDEIDKGKATGDPCNFYGIADDIDVMATTVMNPF